MKTLVYKAEKNLQNFNKLKYDLSDLYIEKEVSIIFIISETLSGRLSFRKLRLADQVSGSFVFLITSLTDLTFNSCYLLSLAELGTIRTRG